MGNLVLITCSTSSSNCPASPRLAISKALPSTLGFGMFLAYFARNHFYPSFDLFQFSSLLLAAACLGFLAIGAFVAALFLPGAWVY